MTSRAPWGGLSRDAIVACGAAIAERDGWENLSMRTVAAALDVTPMALYRHVGGKDDLVAEIVDGMLAEYWRPDLSPGKWRPWITDAADRLRRFLVENPAALRVFLGAPVVTVTARERMAACLEVLRDGLGTEVRARRAYAAIHTYTLGFSALESARAASNPAGMSSDADEAVRELAAFASPGQFRAGLRYLLDGVAADAL